MTIPIRKPQNIALFVLLIRHSQHFYNFNLSVLDKFSKNIIKFENIQLYQFD